MNSKTLIQIFLISLSLCLSFYFYLKISEPKKNYDNQKIDSNSIHFDDAPELKNISYESKSLDGTQFIINAESGEFLDEKKNRVFMKNVKTSIILTNGEEIILVSKKGLYDLDKSIINFTNQVRLDYLDHKIESEKLDVFFKENLVEAYDNLRYKGTNYDLIGDKASINLFNRNIEIFMFDQSKVKVLNTN